MICNDNDYDIRNNENLVVDILLGGPSYPLSQGQIGIYSVGFWERRRTKGAGENPRSQDQNQQQTKPSCTCDFRSGM